MPTKQQMISAIEAYCRAETEKDGAIVANVSNQFLMPTAFSSVK